MSTVSSGKTNSHDNPDEPRDERGRWTTGGSSWRANPVRRPGPAGRAHLLLGHALTSAWHQGLIREFKLPTEDEAGRFARTLRTWNAASDLDPETFRESFTRGLVDKPATIARLRQAASGSAEARSIGQMVDAGRPLTQAIREIGADRWPWVRERLADKAAAAMPAQFAAPVGTTAAVVGTGQTGLAAGDRPRDSGRENSGGGQSRAATNSQSDSKGPSTGLSAGDPPTSGSAGSQHPADWDGTSGQYGDNTRLEAIRQQIYEALKNKKAIAIVGGAGDHWLSQIMEKVTRDMQRQNPGIEIEYFTNDHGEELKKWLEKRGQTYGSDNIAVIGHSWGGGTAMSVLGRGRGVKVGALITIDPVPHDNPIPPDRRRRDSGPLPPLDLGKVRENSGGNWINVNANPDQATRAAGIGFDNVIAGLGEAYNRGIESYADHYFNANINHGDAGTLLPLRITE